MIEQEIHERIIHKEVGVNEEKRKKKIPHAYLLMSTTIQDTSPPEETAVNKQLTRQRLQKLKLNLIELLMGSLEFKSLLRFHTVVSRLPTSFKVICSLTVHTDWVLFPTATSLLLWGLLLCHVASPEGS